jgi:FKBP-type peptidyl-prolyl cis-trans isomerase
MENENQNNEPTPAAPAPARVRFDEQTQKELNRIIAEERRTLEARQRAADEAAGKRYRELEERHSKLEADSLSAVSEKDFELQTLKAQLQELSSKFETTSKEQAEAKRIAEENASKLQQQEHSRKIAETIGTLANWYDGEIANEVFAKKATVSQTGEVLFEYQGKQLSAAEFSNVIKTNPRFFNLQKSNTAGGTGSHNGAGVVQANHGPLDIQHLARTPQGMSVVMDLRKKAMTGDKLAIAQLGYDPRHST